MYARVAHAHIMKLRTECHGEVGGETNELGISAPRILHMCVSIARGDQLQIGPTTWGEVTEAQTQTPVGASPGHSE